MSSNSSMDNVLHGDPIFQAKVLWERLRPNTWPFKTNELPKGTALVGGAVRDGLLNKLKAKPDLDLIFPDRDLELSQKLAQHAKGRFVLLDKQRGIARLVFKGWTIDIAPQEGRCLEEDLLRRDFKINAIALTLHETPKLIDPTGGIKNLQEKRLVAISEKNLIDDPLRILRAFRLIAELKFTLDSQTKTWIKAHRSLLSKSAPERIQIELLRLFSAEWADEVIPVLQRIDLLEPWEKTYDLYKEKIPSKHQANQFTDQEKEIALPLTRLTHLLPEEGMKKLHFSKKLCHRSAMLRKWQKRNDNFSYTTLCEKDRLQLHKDLENDLPALILELEEKQQEIWLKRWRNQEDPLFHPSSPLDGNKLKRSLSMPSSKEMGELLEHLCLERAFGRLHNEQESMQEARNWLQHKKTLL